MIFHRINTGSSQFSTVTKHSKISRREKLSRMTFKTFTRTGARYNYQTKKKLCERVRVVLTCYLRLQVRVLVGLLKLFTI